jgi:hypothetical protein
MRKRTGAMAGVRLLAAFALALAAAAALVGSGGPAAAKGPRLGPSAHARLGAPLTAASSSRLHDDSWWGGTYTAFTGERVHVYISAAYPRDDALGQRWANALASLLHGSELSLVRAYVAPHAHVQQICGRRALGCYGDQELVTIGDAVDGVSAEEVLRHEYGHHVAANRQNPPWAAVAWGTKRWASYMNVCTRAATGMAFPGDQGGGYTLNPGEAFAEAYRVVNEVRNGAPNFTWELADYSFRPDTAALRAVEEDVVHPWTQPRTRVVKARFAGRSRSWTYVLSTPLDGDLALTLSTPLGSTHGVEIRTGDQRVLARGLWSGSGKQTLNYRVCGERSVVVRVTRQAGVPRFTLRIDAPA